MTCLNIFIFCSMNSLYSTYAGYIKIFEDNWRIIKLKFWVVLYFRMQPLMSFNWVYAWIRQTPNMWWQPWNVLVIRSLTFRWPRSRVMIDCETTSILFFHISKFNRLKVWNLNRFPFVNFFHCPFTFFAFSKCINKEKIWCGIFARQTGVVTRCVRRLKRMLVGWCAA